MEGIGSLILFALPLAALLALVVALNRRDWRVGLEETRASEEDDAA